ncbi:B3 domain-containing transcription factor VRN1-like [Euphorbia lathyris]|uniref:B3 domain-containing transcription factor VRN1-like n=1 Tax=Euphorbia lathyris TaxID=212925 RepID=UPI00331369BF
MASCPRKNNGCSLFKAERPHFFKVILADSIPQQKLCIPRKFVKSFGDYLSNPVILKVPSGKKWRVDTVKCDGEIYLQNGWREFAEYYSISQGSFLVFEYEKSDNSEFNVTIFDTSSTEIDYPFSFINEAAVEITPSKEAKVKHSRTSGRQRGNRKTLTKEQKSKAVERAISNFQSQNPSFTLVMQPSYVNNNVLEIPSRFARKYLKKNGDATLNILDGRTWSIKYYSSTNSGTCKINSSGWNKFVKDNDLEVGDVCIFELLEYVDETVFRVGLSRYSNLCTSPGNRKQSKENESCSKQPKLSSDCPKRRRVRGICNENHARKKIKLQNHVRTFEGMKNTKARSSFSSENPAFEIVMQPSNFFYMNKYRLHVPRKFVKNMEQRSQKVKLQFDNKLWSVILNIYPQVVRFGQGWVEFARENSLKVGDVCTFELIDTEILLVRVSISRD